MVPLSHKNVFGNALMVLVLVMLPLMKYFCGLDLKKVKHQKLNWHSFGLGLGMFQKIILNTYAYPIYCIDEYPMYI